MGLAVGAFILSRSTKATIAGLYLAENQWSAAQLRVRDRASPLITTSAKENSKNGLAPNTPQSSVIELWAYI